jgi:hypothetical protein
VSFIAYPNGRSKDSTVLTVCLVVGVSSLQMAAPRRKKHLLRKSGKDTFVSR